MRYFYAFICLLIAGCNYGDRTFLEADPQAVPAVPTYTEYIAPMMTYYCTSCHGGDPTDTVCDGGEGSLNLSSYSCVRKKIKSVIDTSFTNVSMPPGGSEKMTPQDWAIFEQWRDSGFTQ